jgi:hypothetical protein
MQEKGWSARLWVRNADARGQIPLGECSSARQSKVRFAFGYRDQTAQRASDYHIPSQVSKSYSELTRKCFGGSVYRNFREKKSPEEPCPSILIVDKPAELRCVLMQVLISSSYLLLSMRKCNAEYVTNIFEGGGV